MTSHSGNGVTGADIRAKLNHPVVDADGHMIETTFAILDFLKQTAGSELTERYAKYMKHENETRGRRAVWVGNSGPCSIDRATAMLPKLCIACTNVSLAQNVANFPIIGDTIY